MSVTKSVPAPPDEPQSRPEADRVSIPAHVDSWDEYFLNIAKVVSIKSKDPKCPVGAVIVSADNVLLTTGFNGLPRGVHDDEVTLLDADEKLRVICHAEYNAVMNAARIGIALQGATIFVTKFPCLACCNAIIQAGIKRIYTHDESFWNDDPVDEDHSRKREYSTKRGSRWTLRSIMHLCRLNRLWFRREGTRKSHRVAQKPHPVQIGSRVRTENLAGRCRIAQIGGSV